MCDVALRFDPGRILLSPYSPSTSPSPARCVEFQFVFPFATGCPEGRAAPPDLLVRPERIVRQFGSGSDQHGYAVNAGGSLCGNADHLIEHIKALERKNRGSTASRAEQRGEQLLRAEPRLDGYRWLVSGTLPDREIRG
jgi:hypothetical protein